MSVSRVKKISAKNPKITIAVIGLLGGMATALLSNWDKIFATEGVVKAAYSGYRPTGDFETELRYYIEVVGFRKLVESTQRELAKRARLELLLAHPEEAKSINAYFDLVAQEGLKFEDVFQEVLPVYQRHFTVGQIQALNKFYSTEVMQDMVRKTPLLAHELMPIQSKMINAYSQRIQERFSAVLMSE
ncbi:MULTISPECIES: DUF2059 domain-containing protein [unclassified Pseudomonas]|uniref:DUF2059 domain-containing protein n=1 Tax=unclassified Pseudomonas TaxID=196821 RepID=UPI000FBEE9CF|nr:MULTISPECIES: DUF2059 domain-containing protein [unclassified Pseudomonas]MCE5983160.1 DUF2059 domain-containing protein [Pseudomonas sp. LF19]SPO64373.1 exported protein of unknown function [Pseudomonas sp. JV241A]